MDQRIEDYLKAKYGDDYQKSADTNYQDQTDKVNTGSVISSIGDALAGRSPGSQNEYFSQLKKQAKEDTIGKIEKDRNDYVKNISDNSNLSKLEDDDKVRTEENDPTNPRAKQIAAQLRIAGVQVPDGLSITEMNRNYGSGKTLNEIKMKSQVDFNNQKALKGVELNKEMQMAGYKNELEKNKKSDPKSLSGTDKARYDNALMTLKALDDMGSALDGGDNTFSLVGDNNYTRASRNATEAYGRMQSGGAINKDEEARFEKALPGTSDTKEMQRTKILKQREEMISRLKTLGFSPEQAAYSPKDFNYGKSNESGADKKRVIDRQVNQKTGQTRLVYSDGSFELLNSNVAGK